MNNYLVVTEKPWNVKAFEKYSPDLPGKWILVTERNLFDGGGGLLSIVKATNPRYIFIPHWSHLIHKEIYENYECVAFHMTDLPYGRGKEPLQQLLSNGIYETKVTAFKVDKGIDTGPIYMKMPLDLHSGSAEEIYIRCTDIIWEMIKKIVEREPIPTLQQGQGTSFRPWNHEILGKIFEDDDLEVIYDFIRMLDAETYPKAFMQIGNMRLEFSQATMRHDGIYADVRITKK